MTYTEYNPKFGYGYTKENVLNAALELSPKEARKYRNLEVPVLSVELGDHLRASCLDPTMTASKFDKKVAMSYKQQAFESAGFDTHYVGKDFIAMSNTAKKIQQAYLDGKVNVIVVSIDLPPSLDTMHYVITCGPKDVVLADTLVDRDDLKVRNERGDRAAKMLEAGRERQRASGKFADLPF